MTARSRAVQAAGLIQNDRDKVTLSSTGFVTPAFQYPPPDFLKLTSGTTALPRAIAFRCHQLVADCDNICETMGITTTDLNFGAIPFAHSYGFSNLITPLLCRGVPLVTARDRLPRAILDGLGASRATVFPGMPVLYQALAGLEGNPSLPNLRLCISAGAPLAPSTGRRFSDKFGLKVHSFYGSSECGGIAYDASDAMSYEEGFAGVALRNVRVEADGAGDATFITVRSAAVGDRYLPEGDEAVLSGGTFAPSDLVRITPQGLYVEGRASDVINVAGRKLNPLEIESRICEMPGVRNVVVFGVPSPLRNEEPVACVSADHLVTLSNVLDHCRQVLSPWQVPRDVWMVEQIPFSERGKVNRREITSAYLKHRERRAP